MYHRLALAFGKPLKQFLAEIDAHELTEWAAYFDQEPPADVKADARWAHWMALYANAHRGENGPEYDPQDFLESLPWWQPQEVEPDADALREKMLRIQAAFAGNG